MIKEISKLVIKAFNIENVYLSNKTKIEEHCLYINENLVEEALNLNKDYIKSLDIKVINKKDRNVFVNSIMDFIPIATKVLGKIGEGVTHTLTGVCVMLTGIDENGVQVAEFGSSEGFLNEQVIFNHPGTPSDDDIIIHVNVVLFNGMGTVRKAIIASHSACDYIVQNIREYVKKLTGKNCDEKHEFIHSIDNTKKNIAIIKQVAGQGAMYDTFVLPDEPCGVSGAYSIIDLGNAPVLLTPNEYRDGAIRAMY